MSRRGKNVAAIRATFAGGLPEESRAGCTWPQRTDFAAEAE